MGKTKVHFFTKAHFPHNQNSSIYVVVCCSRAQNVAVACPQTLLGLLPVVVIKQLVSVV